MSTRDKYVEAAEVGLTPFLNTAGTPVLRLERADLRRHRRGEGNEAFAALPALSNAASKPIDREVWNGR